MVDVTHFKDNLSGCSFITVTVPRGGGSSSTTTSFGTVPPTRGERWGAAKHRKKGENAPITKLVTVGGELIKNA